MTILLLATIGCRKSKDDQPAKAAAEDAIEGRAGAPQPGGDLSTPVAKVDDVVITVKQLQDAINRQSPYIRQRYASKEQKRTFLDNLVRFEVLAKEAARRGLDKDPDVIQTMKSAMITRLLRDQLSSGIKPDDVPEADMKAYFDANSARFNKPEEVRVSAILLKKKKQADEVARMAKGPEGASNKGFRDLVSRYSADEQTKLRGGDLRYFHRETTEVPKPVVEAAFALAKTGDVAGPVAVGDTYYILKQTGHRKAVNKTFEQVKREIQNELYKGKREDGQKQFVDGLRAKAKIQVHEDNLKKVRVDTTTRPFNEAEGAHGTMDLPAPPPAPARPRAAAPAEGAR